jgi:hypothetical protein
MCPRFTVELPPVDFSLVGRYTAGKATATETFEWLAGGFFLQQPIQLNFAGYQVQGLEVIGYDPATGTFPSTVYLSMFGTPVPYRWEIDGDGLTITTEVIEATFHGRWSEDGRTFSGGWRPHPGREEPGNVAYDLSGSRAPTEG